MRLLRAALLSLALSQDDSVRKVLESLRSDDLAERDRATRVLKSLSPEKLPLLESALDSDDVEVRTRVREAATEILCQVFGSPSERFAARPVASREVMEQWTKDGRPPDRIPKGFERVPCPPSLRSRAGYEHLNQDEILVEKTPVFTQEDVRESEPQESLGVDGSTHWVTSFALNEAGARRFDEAAERLYQQKPPGMLALYLDGVIVSAPVIQSSTFHGRGQISGAKSKEDAERTSRLLKGKWVFISFRVATADRVENVSKLVHGVEGLAETVVEKAAEGEFLIRGEFDPRRQDLVLLWKELRRKGYSILPGKK